MHKTDLKILKFNSLSFGLSRMISEFISALIIPKPIDLDKLKEKNNYCLKKIIES